MKIAKISYVNSKCSSCGTGPVITANLLQMTAQDVEKHSECYREMRTLNPDLLKILGFKKAKKNLGIPVYMSAPVSVVVKEHFVPKSYHLKFGYGDYGVFCSCFKRFWTFKEKTL